MPTSSPKKRILFVDDDPLILQGLQRALASKTTEWDMDFAEGGAKAFEALSRTTYDVVLTDMMMPGIDGAQLLGMVKESSPKTIRLVLSGYSEQQTAMKCVGLAHQYLSKPCDPSVLTKIIARVTAPGFALRNEHVMGLVGRLDHLPSIPALYTQIVQLLNDPIASMDDVGRLIGADMAMTAKILQLVNSSFFALSRRVTLPTEAASFLGVDTLKALVLATNVFGQFANKMSSEYSAEAAARHSQDVGAAARALAKLEGAPRSVVDESVTAGLLHDVGKLILASSLPTEFKIIMGRPVEERLAAERAILGTTHAEVGGYLLGLWGLPLPVVEAITFHHLPSDSEHEGFSALTATHVANSLLSDPSGQSVDMDYLSELGLADRLPAWRAKVLELFPSLAKELV